MTQRSTGETKHLRSVIPLAMMAFAIPLFIWSGFNAGYFEGTPEEFIIPMAVFFAGPVALATAMWAYYHKDTYLATAAGVFGAFWVSYGMLLWFINRGIIGGETTGDVRGFFFIPWAVAFGTIWLGSMLREYTLGLVSLGAAVMFTLLSIGHYAGSTNWIEIGGWIGFATAIAAWYAVLAEMINVEFDREVLPTEPGWFSHPLMRGR